MLGREFVYLIGNVLLDSFLSNLGSLISKSIMIGGMVILIFEMFDFGTGIAPFGGDQPSGSSWPISNKVFAAFARIGIFGARSGRFGGSLIRTL